MQAITNILIVDDEESICQILSEAVAKMDFKAMTSCHPSKALEMARRQHFDMAILDIRMPEMDGISLAKALREINSTLGIIFITGYASFADAVEAIKIGVSDFIQKPVRIEKLLLSVSRIAERLRLEWEVKEKTELLRQSEKLYRVLVDNTADGVALSYEGKIVFQNRAFSRLLGLESMTFHRRTMVDLLHPEDRARAIQDTTKLLKNQVIGPVRYRFRKSDGTYCWVSVNSTVVHLGDKPSVISTFRDINSLVETETIRKDMEKMLRHDMRSHLVSIVGLAKCLLNKTELSKVQQKYCCQIEHSGRQLGKMVETYLDVTRLENGSYRPQKKPFNFMDIVAQTRRNLRDMADRKNVAIVIIFNKVMYALEHRLPFVGDRIYLQNTLDNLVKNAIEASPKNRSVKIKVKHEDRRIWVSIHNWGMVPEQIRPRFFDKYVTAGKKNGTGLGTYMARLVVTSHGGSISLSGSSEDEGTTVMIELPLESS